MAAPSRELEQQHAPAPAAPAREAAAVSPEHGFTPARVIALQRTAGNQAVTGLLDGANTGELPPWLAGAAGGVLGGLGLAGAGPVGALTGFVGGAGGVIGGIMGGLAGGFAPPQAEGEQRDGAAGTASGAASAAGAAAQQDAAGAAAAGAAG